MREGEKLGGSATASTGGKVKRSPGKEPADGGLRVSEPGRKIAMVVAKGPGAAGARPR